MVSTRSGSSAMIDTPTANNHIPKADAHGQRGVVSAPIGAGVRPRSRLGRRSRRAQVRLLYGLQMCQSTNRRASPSRSQRFRSRIVPITPALWNVRPEATDRDLLVQAVAFSGFQLPISADSLYRPGDFVFVAYAGKKEIELVTINISAALTQYPQSCAIHGDAERVVVANAVGRCPWCGGKADQFKRPLQHSRSIIFCWQGLCRGLSARFGSRRVHVGVEVAATVCPSREGDVSAALCRGPLT